MHTLNLQRFKQPSTLMVQGCTSDAGKTIMVAGLCRVLTRKGLSVAPFKPQNMALNSAVSSDGGEIGRAQALQAQACKLDPHTDMNPILLKPSSDTGAQVIVHGQSIGNMQAAEFHAYKKTAMQAVLDSHKRLKNTYKHIIVEGAGSPAEINLRDNDIANMGFAEAIDCPVVIVADIDKGGVFAHLMGTLELLSHSEQERVVGFIINRFRGDIALLEPGIQWLEKRTGKPTLGIIPYLSNFFLDAEDAIDTSQHLSLESNAALNVVVPVLNRISNHTDFDALRLHPHVNLQFINPDQDSPPADLVILPGSKNVLHDLQQLKQAGWQDKLDKHLRYGGKLIGICGGYQMLGQSISDPHYIESRQQKIFGFSYFNAETVLEPEKKLQKTKAQFLPPEFMQTRISAYEIHCGQTHFNDSNYQVLVELRNNCNDGALNADNNVIGTYLHGLFDEPQACNALLKWAGLNSQQAVNLDIIREQQLERLADCLENNMSEDFLLQLTDSVK